MDSSERLLPVSRRGRVLVAVAAGFVFVLLLAPRFVLLYTDWLWFGEVGYRDVWTRVLYTRLALFAVVTAPVAAIMFAAVTWAYRTRPLFAFSAAPDKDSTCRFTGWC